MFCGKCGTPNQVDSHFCNGCGSNLLAQTSRNPIPNQPQSASVSPELAVQAGKSFGRFRRMTPTQQIAAAILFSAVGLFVVIAAGYVAQEVSRSRSDFNQSPGIARSLANTPQEALPTPLPTPELHFLGIAKKPFSVNANSYVYFEFDVPQNAQKARLIGSFEAIGGSGNDVQVIVVDQIGFTNFQNGHQFRTPYSTQRITTDTINVSMRPGHFYLVFNNKFSLLTPKAVTVDIELQYETQ